jgi:hypothetical protein
MKKIYQATLLLLALLTFPLAANAQGNHADVNGDGEVTIADINAVIDAILNGTAPASADVNGDGEVTLADINSVIDSILDDSGPGPGGDDDWPTEGWFSDETIALLRTFGMNLYSGNTPPHVEGVFAMEPISYLINYGWEDEEELDEVMTRMIVKFEDQDENQILFAGGAYYMDLESGEEYPDGDDEQMPLFILGHDNKFTIGASWYNEDPDGILGFLAGAGIVMSGEVESNGIRNMQFCYIIFGYDEDGNLVSPFMVYGDGDGFSYPTEWPEWPDDDWVNAAEQLKTIPFFNSHKMKKLALSLLNNKLIK